MGRIGKIWRTFFRTNLRVDIARIILGKRDVSILITLERERSLGKHTLGRGKRQPNKSTRAHENYLVPSVEESMCFSFRRINVLLISTLKQSKGVRNERKRNTCPLKKLCFLMSVEIRVTINKFIKICITLFPHGSKSRVSMERGRLSKTAWTI